MARTRTSRRREPQANPQANPLKLLSQKGAKKQTQTQTRNISNPTHSGGTGVKRMRLNKRQTAKWKIKRLAPPPRHINVKKRGQVVRKMIVRRNALYPDATGGDF